MHDKKPGKGGHGSKKRATQPNTGSPPNNPYLVPVTQGTAFPPSDTDYETPAVVLSQQNQRPGSIYWSSETPSTSGPQVGLPGQVLEDDNGEDLYDASTLPAAAIADSSQDIYTQPDMAKKHRKSDKQPIAVNPSHVVHNAAFIGTDHENNPTGYLGVDSANVQPLYDAGSANGFIHSDNGEGGYLQVGADTEDDTQPSGEQFGWNGSVKSNDSFNHQQTGSSAGTLNPDNFMVLPGGKHAALQYSNDQGTDNVQIYDMGGDGLSAATNSAASPPPAPARPSLNRGGNPQPDQELYEPIPGEDSHSSTMDKQRQQSWAAVSGGAGSPLPTTDPHPMGRYALPSPPKPGKKVALPLSQAEREEKARKRRKFKKCLIIGAVIGVVILGGVVGVIFAVRSGGNNNSGTPAASSGTGFAVPAGLPDYAPITGFEAGQSIPLNFQFPDFELDEGDTVDQISFAIADLPAGTTFNRGHQQGALWVMSQAQASNNLKITFPNDLSGNDLNVLVPFFIQTKDGTDTAEVAGEIEFNLEPAPTTTTTLTSTTIPTTTITTTPISTATTTPTTPQVHGPGIAVAIPVNALPSPVLNVTVGEGVHIQMDLTDITLDAGDTLQSIILNKPAGATFNLGTPLAPSAEYPNGRQLVSPSILSGTGVIMTLPEGFEPGQINLGYTVITADDQTAAESGIANIEIHVAPVPTTATTTPTTTDTTTATSTPTSTPTSTATTTATTTEARACYSGNTFDIDGEPYCECLPPGDPLYDQINAGTIAPQAYCICPWTSSMTFNDAGIPTYECNCGFTEGIEGCSTWSKSRDDCHFGPNWGNSGCDGPGHCINPNNEIGVLGSKRRDITDDCKCAGGSVEDIDPTLPGGFCGCPLGQDWDHNLYKCLNKRRRSAEKNDEAEAAKNPLISKDQEPNSLSLQH